MTLVNCLALNLPPLPPPCPPVHIPSRGGGHRPCAAVLCVGPEELRGGNRPAGEHVSAFSVYCIVFHVFLYFICYCISCVLVFHVFLYFMCYCISCVIVFHLLFVWRPMSLPAALLVDDCMRTSILSVFAVKLHMASTDEQPLNPSDSPSKVLTEDSSVHLTDSC